MNKMNLATKNSKAQKLVRKEECNQILSKTDLGNRQPLIVFYHNLKSNSVELLNGGGAR